MKEQLQILVEIKEQLPEGIRLLDTNKGELAAFTSYAIAFPSSFLALVDTYDVLRSGLPNFLAVSLALRQCGYQPLGIRIDSGDLSYLSIQARQIMRAVEEALGDVRAGGFSNLGITASNDIHEEVLYSLNRHGHSITAFGIGTHLVTCLRQPALGCVYKLVDIDGSPRIKLSEDAEKITIPGKKEAYRLYLKNGEPVVDVMIQVGEAKPEIAQRILCLHPFISSKRAYVSASHVERLHHLVWDGLNGGIPFNLDLSLSTARARCMSTIKTMVGRRF